MEGVEEALEALRAEMRPVAERLSRGGARVLPTMLTKEVAACELGVSMPRLRRMIAANAIQTSVVGGVLMIPSSEVLRTRTAAGLRKPARSVRRARAGRRR